MAVLLPPDASRRLALAVEKAEYDRNWSRDMAIARSGLSKGAYSSIARGTSEKRPHPHTLAAIDDMFSVPVGTSYRIMRGELVDYDDHSFAVLVRIRSMLPNMTSEESSALLTYADLLAQRRPSDATKRPTAADAVSAS